MARLHQAERGDCMVGICRTILEIASMQMGFSIQTVQVNRFGSGQVHVGREGNNLIRGKVRLVLEEFPHLRHPAIIPPYLRYLIIPSLELLPISASCTDYKQ